MINDEVANLQLSALENVACALLQLISTVAITLTEWFSSFHCTVSVTYYCKLTISMLPRYHFLLCRSKKYFVNDAVNVQSYAVNFTKLVLFLHEEVSELILTWA